MPACGRQASSHIVMPLAHTIPLKTNNFNLMNPFEEKKGGFFCHNDFLLARKNVIMKFLRKGKFFFSF